MKKLMIALAVVVMTVAASAATFQWRIGTGTVYDGYNSGKDGYTAANIGSATAYLFNSRDYSQATLLAALADDTAWSTITAQAVGSTTLTSGKNTAYVDTKSTSSVGTTYTADSMTYVDVYMAILNTDGDYVYLHSLDGQVVQAADVTKISFSSTTTPSKSIATSGNGWYAVPEPTSGLLMLLGLAGLALRRKRA